LSLYFSSIDWHIIAAAVGIGIDILSLIPYVRGMLKGAVRPNVVTFGLWTLIELFALWAQMSAGASWSALLLVAASFNTGLIAILCMFGYGYKKYGLLDGLCLALAVVALILWRLTQEPVTAIIFLWFADFIACVPTIMKAYRDPHSENALAWLLITVGAVFFIASTRIFDVANLIFPIQFAVADAVIWALIFFGQRKMESLRLS